MKRKHPAEAIWISFGFSNGCDNSYVHGYASDPTGIQCGVLIDQDESCREKLVEKVPGSLSCPKHGKSGIYRYRLDMS